MNAPHTQSSPPRFDLGVDELNQDIDAPLEDVHGRDEPTLTKIDFDDLELSLDL